MITTSMAMGTTLDACVRGYISAPLTRLICFPLQLITKITVPFVFISDMYTPALDEMTPRRSISFSLMA